MVLSQGADGGARPEMVLDALGVTGLARLHRKRLLFREAPVIEGKEVLCADD
jgi:hypothetical protein